MDASVSVFQVTLPASPRGRYKSHQLIPERLWFAMDQSVAFSSA